MMVGIGISIILVGGFLAIAGSLLHALLCTDTFIVWTRQRRIVRHNGYGVPVMRTGLLTYVVTDSHDPDFPTGRRVFSWSIS